MFKIKDPAIKAIIDIFVGSLGIMIFGILELLNYRTTADTLKDIFAAAPSVDIFGMLSNNFGVWLGIAVVVSDIIIAYDIGDNKRLTQISIIPVVMLFADSFLTYTYMSLFANADGILGGTIAISLFVTILLTATQLTFLPVASQMLIVLSEGIAHFRNSGGSKVDSSRKLDRNDRSDRVSVFRNASRQDN